MSIPMSDYSLMYYNGTLTFLIPRTSLTFTSPTSPHITSNFTLHIEINGKSHLIQLLHGDSTGGSLGISIPSWIGKAPVTLSLNRINNDGYSNTHSNKIIAITWITLNKLISDEKDDEGIRKMKKIVVFVNPNDHNEHVASIEINSEYVGSITEKSTVDASGIKLPASTHNNSNALMLGWCCFR
ncbi:MAG: hypothetical protein Sylvanvirus22_13 [Sylvanvirus sp.]|uniref:Uncharacterized protein n=1 Tax=Sylvanvirus sp. TaxID=2487774 RepID=A0A3G5AJR6_9VIRU|nr:MAG: hypothetical protein Sylvanvirus22_13 [Sylvanvirus sp.]